MEVVTIQSQAYQEIVDKLDAINTRLSAKEKEPKEKWLDNQELMQLLKISKKDCPTLQRQRPYILLTSR